MLLRPISKGFGRHAHPALLKHKAFEHENEVRGLIEWTDHSRMPSELSTASFAEAFRAANPPGIGAGVDLKNLIEEIYISPLAPCYFREVIEIMAGRHGLADRIRVSTLLGDPVC
jgi:hypothetical protein